MYHLEAENLFWGLEEQRDDMFRHRWRRQAKAKDKKKVPDTVRFYLYDLKKLLQYVM